MDGYPGLAYSASSAGFHHEQHAHHFKHTIHPVAADRIAADLVRNVSDIVRGTGTTDNFHHVRAHLAHTIMASRGCPHNSLHLNHSVNHHLAANGLTTTHVGRAMAEANVHLEAGDA